MSRHLILVQHRSWLSGCANRQRRQPNSWQRTRGRAAGDRGANSVFGREGRESVSV